MEREQHMEKMEKQGFFKETTNSINVMAEDLNSRMVWQLRKESGHWVKDHLFSGVLKLS